MRWFILQYFCVKVSISDLFVFDNIESKLKRLGNLSVKCLNYIEAIFWKYGWVNIWNGVSLFSIS